MAITAADILTKITTYGVDVTITSYASKTYDPTEGDVMLGEATAHTVKALAPYQDGGAMKRFGVPDGVIEASAFTVCSPSGLSFTPKVGMTLAYGDNTWTITAVNPVQYKTEVVLYELALHSRAA
jgi:hypothetical protein